MKQLTAQEAARFLVKKQGLNGERSYHKKEGVLSFLRGAGCVQTDEVDLCGKAHELTLLSRVDGLSRPLLKEMLYQDHTLRKIPDKGLGLIADSDLSLYPEVRKTFSDYLKARPEAHRLGEEMKEKAQKEGFLRREDWTQPGAKAVLEALCYSGILAQSLTEEGQLCYVPDPGNRENFPFENDEERLCARVWRRIGGAGLLSDLSGEAWLGIPGLTPGNRSRIFARLLQEEAIFPLRVEGISYPLYCLAEDVPLLTEPSDFNERTIRLLSPLDNLLWDRKLIAAIFHFTCKWEYNTPPEQREFGAYVLPLLKGSAFAGRIEPVFDSGCLQVRAFWPEKGFTGDNRFWWSVEDEVYRLCRFLGGSQVRWENGWMRG